MILRPYQQAAVDAVYNHLRSKENNPCIVLPTASGKSWRLRKLAAATLCLASFLLKIANFQAFFDRVKRKT